jgi:alkanesulfonate monooxygenase SsuD/methylene tetrahydromethanopterin reductase-like flavin-dependent oxidoreductase (luciferase family)
MSDARDVDMEKTVVPRTGIALRDMTTPETVEVAQAAEAAGLTHLFIPESGPKDRWPVEGRDPFLVAREVLGRTSRLVVGTGIVGTIFRPPRMMALTAATLHEQYPDRFVLGCGVSRPDLAEVVGVPFPSSPLGHAAAYCEQLRELSRGGVAFGGGFPVYLAARGDKMLAVAARLADGALLTLVSPKECERIVALMAREHGEADPETPRPSTVALIRVGPRHLLAEEVGQYLGGVPGYAAQFARQGMDSVSQIVEATGITDLNPEEVGRRLAAYRSVGTSIPCLFPRGLSVAETCNLLADLTI